jgi:hypothetical protein
MSITTTSTKDSYAGNASITTQYPITFKYLEESHVSVYIDGVLQTKGAGADYVMGGDGTTNTGYITTNVAQADTKTITIVLDVPFDQPVDLQETGVLSSSTLEEAYDRLNMQIRRVWRKAQGVLTFSTDEGGAGSQGTADNLLGFDGTGNLTEIPNSKFCETANNLSDVTASTARTNLNVDVAGTDNSTDVTLAGTGTQASLVGQALTINKVTASDINSESATVGQVLQADGDTTCSFVDLVGGGNALTSNPLSQFASTTSAEFAGVISDETGTGSVVFANSPTLVTPALGTPSSVDLTNATNYPETNGTVQGTDGTYDIQATNEGTVAGNARGESSVDLQTERTTATQVASGAKSVLIGGVENTASGLASTCVAGQNNTATAQYAGVIGGTGNTAGANNSFVMGGYGNSTTGSLGTVLVGANSTAGSNALAVGNSATASHSGSRMFADNSATAFASKGNKEFGVQCDNFRVDVGTPAVGQILTCNNVDGSSGWASPAKVVYTVATLPATPAQGDVAMVTDATATTFHSVVAGTGSNIVPVFYDGTNWRIG